jgi:hypothetical protein
LEAARSLLESRHWGPAYYLAGYSVECGLKACIAHQFREHDFPDKKIVDASYKHKPSDLVRTAGLEPQLRAAESSSDDFKVNWATVKDWSEKSRYEERSEVEAKSIIGAIEAKPNGVLEWITQH